MINRDNWVDVRAFLRYQADTMQNSPLTVKSNRGHLQHVLTWADDKALTRAASIKPTLPAHMEVLSRDGKRFSGAYLGSFFKTTRYFLKWLRRENPTKFKSVGE